MADILEKYKAKEMTVSASQIEEAVSKTAKIDNMETEIETLNSKTSEIEKSTTANAENINTETARAEEAEAINRVSVGTQCINLLENNCQTVEVQGVTVTVNDDKSITLNGTNSGSSVLAFTNMQTGTTVATEQYSNNQKWIPTGKYTMSISENATGATLQMRLATEPNDAGTGYTTTTETTVEVLEEHNYVWTRLLISSGASFDNVTVYPMIRPVEIADSTYKAYQPSLQTQIDKLVERITALETAATASEEG